MGDDDDDDSFPSPLPAGARDSSDTALNPASLPQRIFQEEYRERLFGFCMQMAGGQKQVLATRCAVRVERWKGCLVRRALHGPPGHGFFRAVVVTARRHRE